MPHKNPKDSKLAQERRNRKKINQTIMTLQNRSKKNIISYNEPAPSPIKFNVYCYWTPEKVAEMPTDQIINQLRKFGVPINEEDFLNDITEKFSAEEVADSWEERYTLTNPRRDADFLWMAAIELVKRLVPDWICYEEMFDILDDGYNAADDGEYEKSIDLWLSAWARFKAMVPPTIKKIEDFQPNLIQKYYPNFPDFFTDIITTFDEEFFEYPHDFDRILTYIREYRQIFPETLGPAKQKLALMEAQISFTRRNFTNGEYICNQLIEEYPQEYESYQMLAEQYWFFPYHIVSDLDEEGFVGDYLKAKAILEKALINHVKCPHIIKNYLEQLEKQQQESEFGKQ